MAGNKLQWQTVSTMASACDHGQVMNPISMNNSHIQIIQSINIGDTCNWELHIQMLR